jgi:hypothetical protein
MNSILFTILISAHRLVKGIANRVLDKTYLRPRNFSNAMLRAYAPAFSGKVINISGWRDEDGEGGRYQDYFPNATAYAVSNVGGQGKGFGTAAAAGYTEIELDLLQKLPVGLAGTYDVVFNHTTLEHIFDLQAAFKHICELSTDIVIIVVPVMQQIHHTKDFGDYWRPTTMAIAKLFLENGFEPLVIKCNEQPFAPIYCFAIATKNPEKYKDFAKSIDFQMGAHNYGSSLTPAHVQEMLAKRP